MDHLDALKIKFCIEQESDLDSETLAESIIERLTEAGYNITGATELKIKFDDSGDHPWGRDKSFKMMEEDWFDIVISTDETIVRLTYYIDAFIPALIIFFCLVAGICGVFFGFFVSSVFLIQLLIQIYKSKHISNNILSDIIGC